MLRIRIARSWSIPGTVGGISSTVGRIATTIRISIASIRVRWWWRRMMMVISSVRMTVASMMFAWISVASVLHPSAITHWRWTMWLRWMRLKVGSLASSLWWLGSSRMILGTVGVRRAKQLWRKIAANDGSTVRRYRWSTLLRLALSWLSRGHCARRLAARGCR